MRKMQCSRFVGYTIRMFTILFHNLTDWDKDVAIENIIARASPRPEFFLMLTLAIAMTVFGVLLSSNIILIGSMLVAPMLYPLLSLSLGIIVSDEKLIARALLTIGKSIAIGLAVGFAIGLLFGGATTDAYLAPLGITVGGASSLMYAMVAVIAGFAAAFAITKPHLNETMPGVAIAVALVPPLAVAGIGISVFSWSIFSNALLLFFINVIGVMFSAMVVFSLLRFSVKRAVVHEADREDEKEMQKEAAKANAEIAAEKKDDQAKEVMQDATSGPSRSDTQTPSKT